MRKDILYVFLMLIITDLVIFSDSAYLRPIIPFIFFNIVPGYLLLEILKLDEIKFLERIILSVGLSVSLLMVTGLILNSFYPIILKPLSLIPILISLNILVLFLLIICFLRVEKINFSCKINNLDGNLNPLLFSILFPLLMIIGSYIMNYYSNNTILLVTLISIPIYLIWITISRKKIHHATYPFAIFNIALALLIMNGLPSNYLIGRDVHWEYYFFKTTIQSNHWNAFLHIPYSGYNACISITILPTIYHTLLDISSLYIFKFYYGLLGAVIPLGVYLISERILKDNSMAFYAALLFVFQFSFIYLLGWTRQLIALLFFTLAVMIILNPGIKDYAKKILFLIFLISTVFSHYTTSYIFLIIIGLIPIILGISKKLSPISSKLNCMERKYEKFNFNKKNYSQFTSISLAILFFIVIFAWYAQVTARPFNDMISFISNTLFSMGNFFAEDMRNNSELALVGVGLGDLPNKMSAYVHQIIFVIIGIGALILLIKPNYTKYTINIEYLIAVIISMGILASFIALPFVSQGYGGTRLYTQLLVILAPVFVIGVQSITKFIKNKNLNIPLILTMLILLFSCTTYLQYHFYGIPYSYAYDNDSVQYYETHIYDSEVVGAQWLHNYGENITIYSDAFGSSRIRLGFNNYPQINSKLFRTNQTIDGYIYLRYVNVNKKLVFTDSPASSPQLINNSLKMDNVENIKLFEHLFRDKNLIYDNGGSAIYN